MKGLSLGKRRRFREKCGTELHAYLSSSVLPIVADETQTDKAVMGAKVWLLPNPYYRWIRTERMTLLALADFYSQVLTYPRLRRIAEVEMPCMVDKQSSKTRRTLGKGVIGEALFSGRPNTAAVLIHSDSHSDRLGKLSKREFARLSKEIRRGMRREDFLRLSEVYGSTVAVPLSPLDKANGSGPLHPIGVLTIHTAAGTSWTQEEAVLVGDWAGAAVDDCVRIIKKWGYTIPDSADMFSGLASH